MEEKKMTAAVRYQSRNGNTKSVAKIIAQVADVDAKPVIVPLEESVDILFLGGAVYMWDIDKALKEFLQTLDSKKIGCLAAFSTTGLMPFAIWKIKSAAKSAGIPVCRQALCLKLMMQGHGMKGEKGGQLKEYQIQQVQTFARKTIQGCCSG